MKVRDYDPRSGQCFQGDVAILPVPPDIHVSTNDEILPEAGRLILLHGEVSGHAHAIAMPRKRQFRQPAAVADPVLTTRDTRLRKAFAGKPAVGTARLFRDPKAIEALRHKGLLTRVDLAIGLLIVEGGPVTVTHEEHAGIRLPVGNYYVGGQIESAGAEERKVVD